MRRLSGGGDTESDLLNEFSHWPFQVVEWKQMFVFFLKLFSHLWSSLGSFESQLVVLVTDYYLHDSICLLPNCQADRTATSSYDELFSDSEMIIFSRIIHDLFWWVCDSLFS